MKRLILLSSFALFLRADIIDDFKNAKYESICTKANIFKYLKNENLLSIVGISCVKSDRLYLLPLLLNNLKHTKAGRINNIFFNTVLLQKRLLYSYMFDNFDISPFDFPKTPYILSDIFTALKNGEYKKENGAIIINTKDGYIRFYKKDDKIIADEYKHDKLIKRRWYR
ncbi:MAG: hypothetical protein GXO62_04765 [Epsilonproteobacteria bacterium]|nr:hypothetical protein [Campylobacterota bacterium]